jgi:hypothetical protein
MVLAGSLAFAGCSLAVDCVGYLPHPYGFDEGNWAFSFVGILHGRIKSLTQLIRFAKIAHQMYSIAVARTPVLSHQYMKPGHGL